MTESVKPAPTGLGQSTLADVAALAGVSTSAVSRTFTPGASVAKKTRARVLEAAKKLGYRPNAIARTLSTRKSRIIGVVVSYLHNQFYPAVIERLSQLLQAHGYHVLLFISSDSNSSDDGMDSLVLDILQYQVDGIVLASTVMSSRLAAHCQSVGIPVVLFNRVAPVEEASMVTSDNIEGGRLAAQVLLERGARRIGFISGLEDSSTSQDREKGFMEELARHRKTLFARISGEYDFGVARAATRELFSQKKRPDALFVANDHMAFAVMDALRIDLGLNVPQDVQVVGFDDVPQAAWGGYQLTTIEQDSELMTRATVAILLEHIESGAATPRRVVTPVRAVIRATTLPL
ncbi:LacI family DNA-binding transcriptional regulator [Parapusillimonas granuli]|uniref:LacI family DNA-binding transcriptional regulator n=1 Tax=Parapusillimonas granuli TaxID=380911 RepID=A0A853G078_9BURK|nr:LacI family DNA-binding transcriptional regulator [Parapusillimonas granuli]MBB5216145.1 DNA-binding LacI/PurR family transcriptional regulator [Parapusillimonas granuli]MEB2400421.1 LacI family DNA-binding transcriptional regulator [Alcaligenaceae bacterium]NYT47826.1 LacI family DNA-binding transcriptional regulator [Parapusillimonas granuli]